MSLRTTPLWVRTSGPLEPSPGNGPAVSSGMTVQSAAAAAAARAGRGAATRTRPPATSWRRRPGRTPRAARRSRRRGRSPSASTGGSGASRRRTRDPGRTGARRDRGTAGPRRSGGPGGPCRAGVVRGGCRSSVVSIGRWFDRSFRSRTFRDDDPASRVGLRPEARQDPGIDRLATALDRRLAEGDALSTRVRAPPRSRATP